MARLQDVVFDCSRPAVLARFWAAALDGYEVAPYDAVELARLRAQGIEGPEDDPTVLVERPGATPRLWFQQVDEPKLGKNRLHLDLRCDDLVAEEQRLVSLGASRAERQPPGAGWVVLHDPEGNELCLMA